MQQLLIIDDVDSDNDNYNDYDDNADDLVRAFRYLLY